MFPIVIAGLSALVWGTADFCGGKAVQQASASADASGPGRALAVTVVSQLWSLPMISLFLLLVPGQFGVSALGWGALAGIAGFFGVVLLYRGLSTGSMAIVAPIAAVASAVVPMVGGLLQGERPGALALTGAGCAFVAIAFVSLGPSSGVDKPAFLGRTISIALAAGVLFGIFFLLIAEAGEGAGMWPMAGARAASIALGLVLWMRQGIGPALGKRAMAAAALAGLLDAGANGLFLLATFGGDVSIVGPVGSLYPASTVLLALLINKERLRPVQFVGLSLAAAALVLAAA